MNEHIILILLCFTLLGASIFADYCERRHRRDDIWARAYSLAWTFTAMSMFGLVLWFFLVTTHE